MQQFDQLRASELYCPRCRASKPVRERLLLVLPGAELYDYRCTLCGTSVGSREVKAPPLSAQFAARRQGGGGVPSSKLQVPSSRKVRR